MAIEHLHKSWCAFYPEVTQGAPPADWNADAFLIDHLEADPSSLVQSLIQDMTLNTRAKTKRSVIFGLKNVEGVKVAANWHGAEVETAANSQVAETALSKILKHCMGGQYRSYSTVTTGGTAAIPILSASTGVDEGVFLGFEDADDPGRVHIRRVVSWDGGTKAATLDQVLPFTPANNDKVHATIATYIDEDVLEDFETSQNTFSWRIEKGTEAVWDVLGSAANMALSFPRNAPPRLDLTVMAATWRHVGLTKTNWTQTPAGKAPLAVGPDTKIFLQDYGTYTDQTYCLSSYAMEPGINIIPVDTVVTAEGSNMEGRCTYTIGQADTTATVQLDPYAQDWEKALETRTFKTLRYSQVAQAGKAWAIHMSRVEITETPKWGAFSNAQGVNVKFTAHEDLENSNANNAKLWRSTIVLVQA